MPSVDNQTGFKHNDTVLIWICFDIFPKLKRQHHQILYSTSVFSSHDSNQSRPIYYILNIFADGFDFPEIFAFAKNIFGATDTTV